MTPGQYIECIRKVIDDMVDEHPLGASGMMAYSDWMYDLDKIQRAYNCQEIVKENRND